MLCHRSRRNREAVAPNRRFYFAEAKERSKTKPLSLILVTTNRGPRRPAMLFSTRGQRTDNRHRQDVSHPRRRQRYRETALGARSSTRTGRY